MARSRRWTALGIPVAILMVLATLVVSTSAPRASAQDGDRTPHPAHIHDGTCDELGDVVFPLEDVSLVEEGEVQGSRSASPVEVSETEVESPLDDILGGRHAVNIHLSAEEIGEYIACGNVGGRVVDGKLAIGLREVNNSGYTGVAVLQEDDDETDVTVYLLEEGAVAAEEPAAADGEATPAAAEEEATATAEPAADEEATAEPDAEDEEPTAEPEAEAPAGEEVAVDIRNFAYNPDPIEITVGDTVTWTNQDGVPHTATAQDRDVLQSGTLQPGESFSQTFNEAGTFEYFCEFHAGMTGTLIVTEAGAGAEADTAAADEEQADEQAAEEAPAAAAAAVNIQNFSFDPDPIAVDVGATITWTNNDQAPHTATGDNGEFDSGILETGGSFSATFDETGTISYHCNVHPDMTGTIVIE